eukprot:527839-Alexandrium_andersonii.AAC.1
MLPTTLRRLVEAVTVGAMGPLVELCLPGRPPDTAALAGRTSRWASSTSRGAGMPILTGRT